MRCSRRMAKFFKGDTGSASGCSVNFIGWSIVEGRPPEDDIPRFIQVRSEIGV